MLTKFTKQEFSIYKAMVLKVARLHLWILSKLNFKFDQIYKTNFYRDIKEIYCIFSIQ